jgi:hypothetical protein
VVILYYYESIVGLDETVRLDTATANGPILPAFNDE